MATVLTAMMFSLAGIPPLAGFFAKYFVFVAAIEAKLYALAVIGVLAAVVGAYYYLRVIKLMWFDEATGEIARVPARCVWSSASPASSFSPMSDRRSDRRCG
jgi:NADH-quinone oxidoreductase subunit N